MRRGTISLDEIGWIGSTGIEEELGGGQACRARGTNGMGCVASTGAPGLAADKTEAGYWNRVNIDCSLCTVHTTHKVSVICREKQSGMGGISGSSQFWARRPR